MASSGTIRNDFRTGYAVQVSWTVNSQNVANNTTNITVQAQLISTSGSYTISSSATKNGNLTINGTTYNFTFTAGLSGGQTKTVYTKTIDIPHNSDGTKTCSMSCDLGINVTLSGVYWGTVSASGSGVFNTIARASSFTLGAYTIPAGTAFTVYINSAVSSFTHNVYYSFGPNSATIGTGATGVSPTAEYAIPLSHLNAIPNSTSGTGYVSVDTYSGGVYIGTASTAFTITAPSTVIPTFSSVGATVVDAGAATSYGYVQGMSKSTLAISGSAGIYGSTITGYSITGGGFTGTTSSYTTGILNTPGTITFTAKVQDSRGRWSSERTINITVNAYGKPSITSYSALRCLLNGTLDDDGTYVKAVSNFTYSTIGGLNTLTSKIKYRKTGTIPWSTEVSITSGATGVVTGGGLIDVASTYEVVITLVDKFNTITQTIMVATAFVTLDFKAGGKGIAIGKAAETDNLFEVAMDTKINGILTTGDKINLNNNCRLDATSGALRLYTSEVGVADYGLKIHPTGYMDLIVNNASVFNVGIDGILTGKGLTLNTGSTSGSSGLMIYGSATTCNIWCGSGGVVLQSLSTANLHLGQNNTSDMTFYPDRIELKKVLVPLSKVSVNKSNVTNDAQISVNTAGDTNGFGDGVTHIGYWTGTAFNHYFRGRGSFNVNCIGGLSSSYAVSAPGFTNTSDREVKYDITKYDTEVLYNYVKDLDVYGYRYCETDKQYDGEDRHQDFTIGSMVQELPFEVVNYDTTPGGDGKSVNVYAYATMLAGAIKAIIIKLEKLEMSDSEKDIIIDKLEQRILALEGSIHGTV